MSVDDIMSIVNRWQDAPKTIHLGIVVIDLGRQEKEGGEGERKGKSRYERIGVEIYLFECGRIGDGFEYKTRKRS